MREQPDIKKLAFVIMALADAKVAKEEREARLAAELKQDQRDAAA